MGISVDVQTFGVDIKNPEKQKQIFLLPDAWECLAECKKQIDQALNEKNEFQWKIDTKKDIRAHTNTFKGTTYVHIRYWWKDRPTKMGVAMKKEDWEELKTQLTENDESSLGRSVMKQLVRQRVHDQMRLQCEGCTNSWPSQTDHECLMEPQTTAGIAIDKIMLDLPVYDFILLLAQEACKQQLILEAPHQTFKRIILFHMGDIKKEILSEYDY